MTKKTRPIRPLHNFELVEQFLENALLLDLEQSENYALVPKIVTTELNIENFDESLISINSKSYRIAQYRKDSDRKQLVEQIILELLCDKRLAEDEDIKLGVGGAFPLTEIQLSNNAYIIIGLPASGKSGIASNLADEFGAYILDSDYAKRKLPEFDALPFGATLVHEESNNIIFGVANPKIINSLFDNCVELGANIVIPKIGSTYEGILDLINLLKDNKYQVHLTLVELDRVKATQRALERYKKTDRYIPLGLIFDTYGNSPTITFYKIITHNKQLLASYGIISTDVAVGNKPKQILTTPNNPSNLY